MQIWSHDIHLYFINTHGIADDYIILPHVFIHPCYLPEGGHICTRPKVERKCALLRADNIADTKNPCIASLGSNVQCFI